MPANVSVCAGHSALWGSRVALDTNMDLEIDMSGIVLSLAHRVVTFHKTFDRCLSPPGWVALTLRVTAEVVVGGQRGVSVVALLAMNTFPTARRISALLRKQRNAHEGQLSLEGIGEMLN